jgi:transposase
MADLTSLSREELIELIAAQQRMIEDQQRQIAELREEIDQLRRGGKRQAAPFSKGQRVANPKPPGRKPGQGPFTRREVGLEEATETILAAAPECCPDCGGDLEVLREEVATTTDTPPRPRAVVTAYRVSICRCQRCGRKVRGSAPGLAADQTGATAHRVGPNVMAAAHMLHYSIGIPVRRVPAVLAELTGVSVTQSALTQDALRRAAGPVGAAYRELRRQVTEAPVVYTDDTGWRVGGRTAFLMGFDTDQATVYQIRDRHRNEEVREIIPADYQGTMVSDRGKSYDAQELAEVAQQKCNSHVIRNVSDVLETKRGPARRFATKLKTLLQDGLALWHARGALSREEFQTRFQRLDQKLTDHLRNRILRDDDNQNLLNGIGAQHDRGHLLRYLDREGVEPTNNRAERILRPAVIARKVSHCSKNRQGAEAFSAFVSIAQTARKTARQTVSQAFRALFVPPAAADAIAR